MSALGAALLVTLLPTQAWAVPPDPDRSGVELEDLQQDALTSGSAQTVSRTGLVFRAPVRSEAPPDETVVVPPGGTGSVAFAAPATTASATSASTTTSPASVTEGLSAAAGTQAGSLPVKLAQAADQPAPTGTWQVKLFDRSDALANGLDGALMTVTAPATGSVPVGVQLDYSKFENLYGADWASRLKFVQFPECYLTTPDVEGCDAYEELETDNDAAAKTVSATVDTAADGTVSQASANNTGINGSSGVVQASYAQPVAATGDKTAVAVIDSGAGPSGTFKATALAASGKWEAGGSSGAFTYSYPLQVPPAPAGPTPQVSFTYNSQSVDGKTAVSSPQASWVGEGWGYDPGHIERRYRSCQDDRKDVDGKSPNNTAKKDKTPDLCWVSYNAVMTLNGRTTELVRVGTTDTYRSQSDDGTRIERKTGGDNGDENGEYWVVTTTDGTKYFFGLNKVGGSHADTQSVFTAPVFGNHPDEPCRKDAFADSRCTQAWQWGLDKVVDTNGNTMIVNWQTETNYYAANKKFKSPVKYVRGGYPTSIEYGLRPNDLTKPAARVVFDAKERCLASDTACDPANFDKTKDPAAYRPWWDSPGNLNCKSDSKLCPAFPSFWTRMRLDAVSTEAARPGVSGLATVDRYDLDQSFPRDWYHTSPSLWLNSITRYAYRPGDTKGSKMPPVTFSAYTVDAADPLGDYLADKHLPNLVPRYSGDPRPGFNRPRIGTVTTEAGEDIEVTYAGGCKTEPSVAPENNHGTCFPVRWSPDGDEKKPAIAWFNKYVVTTVSRHDKVSSNGQDIITSYSYDNGAWGKDDDEFSKPDLRTYNVWRGYQKVTTLTGNPASGPDVPQTQSKSVTRYFRGAGGTLKDSKDAIELGEDRPEFAGLAAEALVYDSSASGAKLVKRTLTFPESKQTASRARDGGLDPILARRVWARRSDAIQTVGSSWRSVRTETVSMDTDHGLPLAVETSVVQPDSTGAEKRSNYTCAKTDYANNDDANIIGLAKQVRTTATSCASAGSATADQLISAVRNTYDNKAWGEAPTVGLVTTEQSNTADGTGWIRSTHNTYDPLGRIRIVTNAKDVPVSRTEYTPGDAGGPVTEMKVTDALGHYVKTTLDPGRGLVLTRTDTNGRVTRSEFDAFGRLIKGWTPSHSSGTQNPDVQISYQVTSGSKPTAVTVQSLRDDGGYDKQITLYDGMLRPIQTQAPAHGPGRVITDTRYNDHGLMSQTNNPYLAPGEPQAAQFKPKSDTLVPSGSATTYDGLERSVKATTVQSGSAVYSSTTTYGDDYTIAKPVGGAAPATKTWTDPLGRVSRIQHYTKSDLSQWRDTTYEYDARGKQKKVTDEAGSVWSYLYDARGRLTDSFDPDTGHSSFGYDDLDRRTKVVEGREKTEYTVHTDYDDIGRVIATREGSASAAPTREWEYDTLPGADGMLAAAIRHDASGDYVSRITGYDTGYRVTSREITIPNTSPLTKGVSGTYKFGYTYTPTGKPRSTTLPATPGGLAQEEVITRYDSDGLAESTSGLSWYTADASYSPYGEVLRTVTGPQPYRVWTTNFIDDRTGRLQRTVSDRETAGPHRLADTRYSYDTVGNITSQSTGAATTTSTVWDTQCFTYDAMGELVHAWTSNITPGTGGTGCKSANGTTWGYRGDGLRSAGPIANAPDAQTDATAPDDALKTSLTNAAPDTSTVATGTGTTYWDSYTFDAIGNRATQTQHATASGLDTSQDITRTYGHGKLDTGNGTSQPVLTQPHTLTSVTNTKGATTTGTQSYVYDAAGNTTVRPGTTQDQSLTWTAEEKLDTATAEGNTTQYVYDADGNRILQSSSAGTTLYLGETEVMTDGSGTPVNATRAYAQAGAPTVIRTTNGSATSHKLSCTLTDRLGTATIAVDLGKDQIATRRAFKPYGETRGTKPSNWPNQHTYLGVGIDDTNTGLTHLGAREYDQNTGRFISADPVFNMADPLQSNGYSYANNNPVTKSDPTGLCPKEACEGHGQNTADTPYEPPSGGSGGSKGQGKDKQGTTVVRNNGQSNVGTACTGAAMGAMKNPHDVAVCKTGEAAAEWASQHNIDGYVTVGVGTGKKEINGIPKGHRNLEGEKDGEADVILWTKDTVYIWEVKPRPGKDKDDTYAYVDGPLQLDNYVNKLRTHLRSQGDSRSVQTGPYIARKPFTWTTYRGAVWSLKAYPGMRFYGLDNNDDEEPTPQPSPGSTDLPTQRPTRTPTAEPTPSATGTWSGGSPATSHSGEAAVVGGGVTLTSVAFWAADVLSKGPACLVGGMC
ncbi:RHS repeat-associated core domain-containing protein [Streptomyces sp. NBC_00019]|uniref:RHS repeat-associated core domain-containing protein n=1 Tax=Streptomyces sp. NBC_00019 TaxID=2975623 RepID=UPI0032451A2D